MTLEDFFTLTGDFFTLTEMKDGLTVPARVEELVSVMKKEKDCVIKNIGDATRLWSTVASVIAVTNSKDCLDLFIQLDGLKFMERWLKNVQRFSADANDCFVEESISALLQALEKLKIDIEKVTASGICLTVKDLLSHKSNSIQDKAKALLGNLMPSSMSGDVQLDSEEVQAVCDDRTEYGNRLAGDSITPICCAADTPDQKADIERHVHQLVGNDAASTGCCGDWQFEGVGLEAKEANKLASCNLESDHKEVEDKVESSVREEACPLEGKLVSQSAETEQGTDVKEEGVRLECSQVVSAEIHDESLPDKLTKVEVSPVSVMPKFVEVSSSLVKNDVLESDRKAVLCTENHIDSSTMKSMSADENLPKVGTSTGADDDGALKNSSVILEQKVSSQGDERCTKCLQDSPVDGRSMMGKPEEPERTYPQNDNLKSIDKFGECAKHDSSHLSNSCGFEPSRGTKSVNVTSKTSAVDLEYGMVDGLEVACLVAKEVERQVVEDEQRVGSSSERSLRGGTPHLADSPDSLNGKKDQQTEGNPSNESPTVEQKSVDGSPKEDKPLMNSDNVDAEQENGRKDTESSQGTELAPESAFIAEKGTPEIDLNLEICSEDADDAAANSVPDLVSVASASRASPAPQLPASPLQFEGSLGWKGSAVTSAFRPASLGRSEDDGKSILVEEATSATRQKQDFGFDLNIAEEGDDSIMNPVLPGLPSGESLIESSATRPEKFRFDLNQMSEDGDAPPSDQKSLDPKTAHCSPSPASSSSPLKPAMKNFDLNDRPSNLNYPSHLHPYLGISSSHKANACGGSSDDSVISIMGAKVKKNTLPHQIPISFLNGGRVSEPIVDANLTRAGPLLAAGSAVRYVSPPVYSYNSTAIGPPVSYSSPMYVPGGSAAYMVDSRGVSLVPQLIARPPSTVQPSFTGNMAGPLLGPNGSGHSHPNLHLNSGFVIEGVNRDPGGFRQLLTPGQIRSVQEHLEPLFPGAVGGKRKEPDTGWQPYLTNYKHHQQPHL